MRMGRKEKVRTKNPRNVQTNQMKNILVMMTMRKKMEKEKTVMKTRRKKRKTMKMMMMKKDGETWKM